MKFLTRNGIILVMAVLALLGAVAGYSLYTFVYAQPFILCGSNDPDFVGSCAPVDPGTGDDIVAIGPNPVGEVDGNDGDDQMFNGAVQTEGISCAAPSATEPVTMIGGEGDDLLVDNDNGNTLEGGEGNDVLLANGGCDALIGGDGDDFLSGGAGDDSFSEGEGSDIVIGGQGLDEYTADTEDGSNDIFVINAGDVPNGRTEEILCGEGGSGPNGQTNTIVFIGFGTTVIVDANNDPTDGIQVIDPSTGGIYEFNRSETPDDPETPDVNEAACDQIISM